ncbi:MAG: hypothetical protein JXR25_00510 [Pontiellaceae bacterium]|nr:hypothetical protein [Pontiellaceae bacterium]MBN2783279.1 hypothetical protein [Pontiellaceae bacterium]
MTRGKWVRANRCLWVVMSLLGAGVAYGADDGGYRTFTGKDGRTLRARITEYNRAKNEIRIERPAGKTVWVSPGIFAECDHAYISEWIEADRFLSPRSLNLNLDKKSSTGSQGKEIIHYEISLRNSSGRDMENVQIEYRYFLQLSSSRFSISKPKRMISGVVKAGSLDDGRTATVRTATAIDFEEFTKEYTSTYNDQYGVSHETKSKAESVGHCEVQGIWIRIQGPDVDGKPTYRELCHPESLSAAVRWNDEERVPMEEDFTFWKSSQPDKNIMSLEEIRKRGKAKDEAEYKEWMMLVEEQLRLEPGKEEMSTLESGFRVFYEPSYDEYGSQASVVGFNCLRRGLYSEAVYWLEIQLKSLCSANPPANLAKHFSPGPVRQKLANIYACGDDASVRNGAKAVSYAKTELDNDEKNENLMDLMARAYAANGQFDLAVKMQKNAIDRYQRTRGKQETDRTLIAYNKRLELYESGTAYVETDARNL